MGGSMEPPAGTIVPVADVSDTGTGVVPSFPGTVAPTRRSPTASGCPVGRS